MGLYPSSAPYVEHFDHQGSKLLEKNGYFYWEIYEKGKFVSKYQVTVEISHTEKTGTAVYDCKEENNFPSKRDRPPSYKTIQYKITYYSWTQTFLLFKRIY